MKKIIKLFDKAVELRLHAEAELNNLCYTRSKQEEMYEAAMLKAAEAEENLFAAINALKAKKSKPAKEGKKKNTVKQDEPGPWPYPPT